MEIILKADVKNLGDKDDIVKVRDGYALNFLIPQGLAIPATSSAKKVLAEDLKQASHRQEKIKAEALQVAERLKDATVRITALAGKEGKIFGSITPLQVVNTLKEQGFDIDRRRVVIADEIRTIGTFRAIVSLHKEVKVEIALEVVEKNA